MFCEQDLFGWAQLPRSEMEDQSQLADLRKRGWMHHEYEQVLEEWEVRLTQKDEEAKMAEGLLHNSPEPRLWRGGARGLEDAFCRYAAVEESEGKKTTMDRILARWIHQSRC